MTRILINWRFRFLRIYKKTRWNLHSNFSYHISSHNINGKRFCAVAKKKRLKAIILTSLEMTSDFTFLFVFMSQYYCFCNVTEWHIFFFRKTNFLGIAKPKCFTIQSFSQWYGCGILQSSCSIISLQYFHWRGMFVSLYYIGISCALFFNQKDTTLQTLHKYKVYAWWDCLTKRCKI